MKKFSLVFFLHVVLLISLIQPGKGVAAPHISLKPEPRLDHVGRTPAVRAAAKARSLGLAFAPAAYPAAVNVLFLRVDFPDESQDSTDLCVLFNPSCAGKRRCDEYHRHWYLERSCHDGDFGCPGAARFPSTTRKCHKLATSGLGHTGSQALGSTAMKPRPESLSVDAVAVVAILIFLNMFLHTAQSLLFMQGQVRKRT